MWATFCLYCAPLIFICICTVYVSAFFMQPMLSHLITPRKVVLLKAPNFVQIGWYLNKMIEMHPILYLWVLSEKKIWTYWPNLFRKSSRRQHNNFLLFPPTGSYVHLHIILLFSNFAECSLAAVMWKLRHIDSFMHIHIDLDFDRPTSSQIWTVSIETWNPLIVWLRTVSFLHHETWSIANANS